MCSIRATCESVLFAWHLCVWNIRVIYAYPYSGLQQYQKLSIFFLVTSEKLYARVCTRARKILISTIPNPMCLIMSHWTFLYRNKKNIKVTTKIDIRRINFDHSIQNRSNWIDWVTFDVRACLQTDCAFEVDMHPPMCSSSRRNGL